MKSVEQLAGILAGPLATISARFPGRLPPPTLEIWASDFAAQGFEPVDLDEAGRELGAEHAALCEEKPDEARRWRLDFGPLLAACKRARKRRIERESIAPPSRQLESRANPDALHVQTAELVGLWIVRRTIAREPPSEDAIAARRGYVRAALEMAKAAGFDLASDGVEMALAASAIERTLRRFVGDLAQGR